MSDSEVHPSKKRVAGRQISKDHPESDEDAADTEMGTFQKASEEVMATRRIVKIRRNNPPAVAPSSNPFAAIRLVPSEDCSAKASDSAEKPHTGGDAKTLEQADKTESSEIPAGDNDTGISELVNIVEETEDESRKTENVPQDSSDEADDAIEEKLLPVDTNKEGQNDGENINHEAPEEARKNDEETQENEAEDAVRSEGGETKYKEESRNGEKDTAPPSEPVSSFGQLSGSKNAFTSLTGPGFSNVSVGSLSGGGFSFGKSAGTLFDLKNENASFSFGTGSGSNGNSSLGFFGDSDNSAANSKPTMQEVPIETGEENEKAVFCADALLYEYLGGGWKERGKGEIKLNISLEGSEKARLIMRAKGNYRLILNASLYPDMSLTNMDKRGITFACVNCAGETKGGLTTFAVKFKDSSLVEEFRVAVTTHRGRKDSTGVSENPPEGSDASAE